eukprot:Gb_08291 [translate_table: standard]
MEEHRESSIKFGVLGCADIFRKLRRAIQMAEGASLHAIGSRSLDKVKAFAAANNIPEETKLYGSYQEVIDDEEVDVVYIPLPTSLHVEWAVKAAEKNKHILLEKPPALTVEDLDKILAACDSHGVQLMDGTMWVHHPRTAKMKDLITNPHLFGDLKGVHVTFSYAATPEFHETDIRMKPDLDALGAQGDIGWYCCRAILWANEYQMPQSVRAMPGPKFNSAGVVVSCGATFEWEDGRLATYHVSFLSHMTMNLIVQGTKGTLHVEDFCIPFEETWASFKFISGMKFKQLALGWENKPEEQKVTVEKPQEVVMIEEISTIVKNVRDGVGKADPHWPTIARKTQVLVNAVMESIHSNFSTIQI